MYIPTFIKETNRKKEGKVIKDPSYSGYSWNRSYINSLIKLGYLERVEDQKLLKLKNIPTDLTRKKVLVLSKGLKLPKRQNYSSWGILIDYINSYHKDDILIKAKDMISTDYSWSPHQTIRAYIGYLERLEFIEYIERGKDDVDGVWFKIKRLQQIPDKLTVTLAQKKLYDNMYKRKAKIDKIKEQMNNI